MAFDTAKIEKHISTGCHGSVYKAIDIFDGKDIAVKRYLGTKAIKCIGYRDAASRTEVDLLQRIDHPNIINIHKVCVHNEGLYITMDLADSNLETSMKNYVSEELRINYCEQIISAFDFLNRNSILHCDFKCENILVFGNIIKLCDFGNAFCYEERPLYSLNFLGPQITRAPELLGIRKIREFHPDYEQKYPLGGKSLESIVKGCYYSLGVVIYSILRWQKEGDITRYRLILDLGNEDINTRKEKLRSLLVGKCFDYVSPLSYLLSANPNERPIGYEMLNVRREGTLKFPKLTYDPLLENSGVKIYYYMTEIIKRVSKLNYNLVRLDIALSLMVKCHQYSLTYKSPYILTITPDMISTMVIYASIYLSYFGVYGGTFSIESVILGTHKEYHKNFIEDFYRDHKGVVTYDRLSRYITNPTLLCYCFPYYMNVNEDINDYIYSRVIPADIEILPTDLNETFNKRKVMTIIERGLIRVHDT